MIKATFLFGKTLIREYEEQGKITPEMEKMEGEIHRKEFASKEEYNAYSEALNVSDGWEYFEEVDYTELNEKEIICTKCGGKDVVCAGVINPNTSVALSVMDGAYNDARCNTCGSVKLSDVNDALDSITKAHTTFLKRSIKQEPVYADCIITYPFLPPDDINKSKKVTFKFNGVNECDPELIYLDWQSVEHFKKFVRPGEDYDFVIIECTKFY